MQRDAEGCRGVKWRLPNIDGQVKELLHMRVAAACEDDLDQAQRAYQERNGGGQTWAIQ